jgi:sugar (pentulose or hexulose) kinase
VPIEPERLPDLIPPAQQLGEITTQAAEATGIPAGLPLMAAAADKACEVIGAGCLDPHTGCLSYGTTATINTTHERYVEVIPLIPPLILQVEALFDTLVNQVPPGSMGLMLQPYWSPGVKVPGPEAKGAIIGFGDVHTRAHLYRAILEGVAYSLREGKERTERRSGIPITELRVAGGGSQSDAALQLTADIFGLPTARPHVYEASGLGAAIDAAVGLGLHPSFETAVQRMTRIGQAFEPDPNSREIYEGLYQRVYKAMYARLKPLYEEIQEITGYPSRLSNVR